MGFICKKELPEENRELAGSNIVPQVSGAPTGGRKFTGEYNQLVADSPWTPEVIRAR
jgi:hypothetical protein